MSDGSKEREPNRWYELSVRYAGPSTITFGDSAIAVTGTAFFEHDATGEPILQFDLYDWEQAEGLFEAVGLYQWFERVGHAGAKSVTIQDDRGTLVASGRVRCAQCIQRLGSPDHPATLRFEASSYTYSTNTASKETCFAMPLVNLVLASFGRWHELPKVIGQHPLRIYPTPEVAGDPSNPEVRFERDRKNRVIAFPLDDGFCYIEALPEYKEVRERLSSETISRGITAMLVGGSLSRNPSISDKESSFRHDLLNLLDLASGHHTGSPWIEYRDSNGLLSRREHSPSIAPKWKSFHPVLDDDQKPDAAYFLSLGLSRTEISSRSTRLLISHMTDAGCAGLTLDDKITNLARAFEILGRECGCSSQVLRDSLTQESREFVADELRKCRTAIFRLSRKKGRQTDRATLERIAGRVDNADRKENAFGLIVAAVCEKLGLEDYTALHALDSSRQMSWSDFLSKIRGCVLHEGGLDFGSGDWTPTEVYDVCTHLLDLLIRVLMKRLGSQEPYFSPIRPFQQLRALDWVTEQTQVTELLPCFGGIKQAAIEDSDEDESVLPPDAELN
ncbi:hypothetical protein [Botrimarina mediterranea]|uniref:ApeA N-terminal domain-containing protein n=1 Tax=Botrimarina mediterranea TaxID=2528022 RepID=A0A518K926_9BACT|nr:hypothetical protein [Botrimarina mediterranea]QDV74294.1 hypothetical protein Spa11_24950 [Botrimarina mediterranea]